MTARGPSAPSTPSASSVDRSESRSPADSETAAARLAQVLSRIEQAMKDAGRQGPPATLVAVSKTMPADKIRPVLDAGHRIFGENRVQEAQEKWPALRSDFPDSELHLIGSLQTNKAKDAVTLFDVIQSIDRPKLARAIAAAAEKTGRRPRCLVQVNTGEEDQKSGVQPDQADALIDLCRYELDLPVEGLMCIPPVDDAPAPHFALLAEIARRNRLSVLSMGMSADFEEAIRFGATHVRVGTAIFGPRRP